MAPVKNGRVILGERIHSGYPVPGKTIVYDGTPTIDLDAVALDGGVLVKTLVFSIDPSMRHRIADIWVVGEPISNFGIGRVLRSENPDYKTGDIVEGLLNLEEYTIVKKENILVLDFEVFRRISVDPELPLSAYTGVLSLPGKTAYYGWKEYASPNKGDVVFVTTGAGSVGSAVIQLAKLDGLKVIASAGSDEKVAWMKELGADVAFNYKTASTEDVLKEHGPINIYWDNVGGETLDLALTYSAPRARFIECGMASGYNTGFNQPIKNLGVITYKQTSLFGLFVLGLEDKYRADFEKVFPTLVKEGKIKYNEDVTRGLESVGEAILKQQQGKNVGKSVVIVAEE